MQQGLKMKKYDKMLSNVGYLCFYIAVIIEVMIVVIDKSNYTNPVEGRLFQLTFGLCFLKVCLTRYTIREYVTIFLFCVLGMVSYFFTGRNEIIRLVMLTAACKNVDMEKCLKLVFGLTSIGCLVIVLLSLTGIYGEISLTMDFGRGGTETRYALGMGHPNALHCMVWALTALGLYLYSNSMKLFHYVLILVMNLGVFFLSYSRTSLLVGVFTIFLFFLTSEKRSKKLRKIGAWIGGISTAGSIAISIIFAANAYRIYDHDWCLWYKEHSAVTMFFVKLNNILNGRIRILTETDGWEGSISSWRLFSKPETEYFFDLGWVRMFYWYGIIPTSIFIFVLLMVVIYCYCEKKYLAITLIASFSVYTIIEAHAVSDYLARNYVFFVIGTYWSSTLLWLEKGKRAIKNIE